MSGRVCASFFHVKAAVSIVTLCSDELNEKLRPVVKLMGIKYSKDKPRQLLNVTQE